MVILCSLDLDYAIWLGMEKGSVYKDRDTSTEPYKVEVKWWRPTGSSNDMKELYKNCVNKEQ